MPWSMCRNGSVNGRLLIVSILGLLLIVECLRFTKCSTTRGGDPIYMGGTEVEHKKQPSSIDGENFPALPHVLIEQGRHGRNIIPSCRRAWPFFPTWHNTSDSETAYFTVSNDTNPYPCQMPPKLSKEDMTQCLQNRNIFLLGNSIARQFAYHVPILLGKTGEAPDLESQKAHCPKAYGGGGCSIDAPYNVTVRSFWFIYWNGKPKQQPLPESRIKPEWENDVCGDLNIDDCLTQRIFHITKPSSSDILVTNVGIIYTLLDPSGVPDIHGWRVRQVRQFIRALNTYFPGTVIWMTGSKQLVQNPGNFRASFGFYYADERTRLLDLQITPIIQAVTNWTIYDGYHITEPLGYHTNPSYFVDPIHHPGRLTQVGWEYMLGYYCTDAPPTKR